MNIKLKYNERGLYKKDMIQWLCGIRGVACAIVLIAHIISVHESVGIWANGCGKIGVWLFMLLAGFFLVYKECDSLKKHDLKWLGLYYKKKIIKLYPLYCIALLFSFFLEQVTSLKQILNHLFLMDGLGHFWYMAVIIKFYLICPCFILIRDKIKKKIVWYLCLLGMIVILSLVFPYWKYVENSISIAWYLPVFLIGMLMAEFYIRVDKKHICSTLGDLGAILFVVLIIIQTPFIKYVLFDIQPSNALQNKYLIMSVLWCGVILSAQCGKTVKSFLQTPFWIIMAKNSYLIYLIHFTILQYYIRRDYTWLKTAIMTIAITVLCCIGYKLFCGLLKKWLISWEGYCKCKRGT